MPNEKLETRWFDGDEYVNASNAASYLGYSGTGFRNLRKRLEGTEDEIPVWEIPRQREKYIKKKDLDRYLKPQRVRLSD